MTILAGLTYGQVAHPALSFDPIDFDPLPLSDWSPYDWYLAVSGMRIMCGRDMHTDLQTHCMLKCMLRSCAMYSPVL